MYQESKKITGNDFVDQSKLTLGILKKNQIDHQMRIVNTQNSGPPASTTPCKTHLSEWGVKLV